jgi:hypothetical protein
MNIVHTIDSVASECPYTSVSLLRYSYIFNTLKPNGNYTPPTLTIINSEFCPQSVYDLRSASLNSINHLMYVVNP